MCVFITATLRGSVGLESVKSLFPNDWRSFQPCNNPFVLAQLPPGTIYLHHTGNWCDCGTAMGAGLDREKPAFTEAEALKMMKKKRWTEDRLRRWKENKLEAHAQSVAVRSKKYKNQYGDLDDWLEFVREMLEHPSVDTFGLMHHFYSTGPATEEVEIRGVERMRLRKAKAEDLANLPRDTVLEFTL